jgi:hypothetical protein
MAILQVAQKTHITWMGVHTKPSRQIQTIGIMYGSLSGATKIDRLRLPADPSTHLPLSKGGHLCLARDHDMFPGFLAIAAFGRIATWPPRAAYRHGSPPPFSRTLHSILFYPRYRRNCSPYQQVSGDGDPVTTDLRAGIVQGCLWSHPQASPSASTPDSNMRIYRHRKAMHSEYTWPGYHSPYYCECNFIQTCVGVNP